MKFISTPIAGLFLIDMELKIDERGFFARTFCHAEFIAHGLNTEIAQCSVSHNARKGTLRGMHFQEKPYQEAKLVRVTSGVVHDVVIDLRSDSSTYLQSFALQLSVDNGRALYIPEGCAHGFQTLADDTDVFYQISTTYQPEYSRGVRWDDPAFGIEWPIPVPILSSRDASYEDWQPAAGNIS